MAEEDSYAVQDRINYALGVKRMTAPWPEPTPSYILEIIDRNYEAGKTVFATAGEVRGQMIVHRHDTPEPHTVNRTT